MKIAWSPEAVDELRRVYGNDATAWRLVYDAEGCGCAVDGVPVLRAVNGPEPGDAEADSAPLRTWYDPRHRVFFEDAVRIGFDPDSRRFRMASDQQIYTSRLVIQDKRTEAARSE